MSDLKLTPSLLAMLERIEQHSPLLMLAVTASGGQDGKLNKLRGAGYVVKCDHPTVTEGAWPAEALAITEAGRAALEKHRAEIAEKKGRRRPDDKKVIFRRDGDPSTERTGLGIPAKIRLPLSGDEREVEPRAKHSNRCISRKTHPCQGKPEVRCKLPQRRL